MQLAQLVLREQAGPERLDRPLVVTLGRAQRHLDDRRAAGRARRSSNSRRSASMIASRRIVVTNRAVAPCRSSRSSSSRRRRWAVGSSSETNGSSSSSRLGLDRRTPAPAPRGAPCRATGARRRQLRAAPSPTSARAARDPRRRVRRRRAGRGAGCPRPCARAAGAAPGRRSRARRAGAQLEPAREVARRARRHVEQRGLAAARRADQRQPLARRDRRAATFAERPAWPARRRPRESACSRDRVAGVSAAIGRHGARAAAGCPIRSAGRRR